MSWKKQFVDVLENMFSFLIYYSSYRKNLITVQFMMLILDKLLSLQKKKVISWNVIHLWRST